MSALWAVALYTSAWIEIAIDLIRVLTKLCRTLHECVDWNYDLVEDYMELWTSHSTRVRGLKSKTIKFGYKKLKSHSTRVRGLK